MLKIFDTIKNIIKGEKTGYISLIQSESSNTYSYSGDYFKSDIVRACIRPFSNAIGKLEPKIIQTDKNGNLTDLKDDFLKVLLKYPNPYMTGQVLFEKLANQLKLNNNAFCHITRNQNGLPVALYPIAAYTIEKLYDKNGELFLTCNLRNNETEIFSYRDIIHIRKDFTDYDDIFGESPAQSIVKLMQVVECGDDALVKAVKNGGILRWILTLTGTFKSSDLKKQAQQFAKDYLSSSENDGIVAAQDSQRKIEQLKPTDYVPNASLQGQAKERIYSFFGTNEKIVKSTYTEDEWNAYYENEIEPVAKQFSEELSRKLLNDFDLQSGKSIVFDTKSLQFASMSTKLNLLQMVDRGAMTPNEWRATLNLPSIEGGEKAVRRLDTAIVEDK